MGTAAFGFLCTYLALKLVQAMFGGKPGPGNAAPGLRAKLLRGEPLLLLVAFAISVPAALWASWYVQRSYARGFEHSVDCYGRLRAVEKLAVVGRKANPYEVYKMVVAARGTAFLAARELELAPGSVEQVLADRMRVYGDLYSAVSRQADPRRIRDQADAAERCLNEPLINM